MKMAREIIKYLLLALLVGYVVAWVKTRLNLDLSSFSKDVYTASLVTFSTGAMVSIFLTVFHSDSDKLALFREKYHARTLYMLVVVNNALIVFLSGLTDSKIVVLGVGLGGLVVSVSTALGVCLTWFVGRVITLFFSRTP